MTLLLENCRMYFTYFDFQFHCADQWCKIAMLCCDQKVCRVNSFSLCLQKQQQRRKHSHSTPPAKRNTSQHRSRAKPSPSNFLHSSGDQTILFSTSRHHEASESHGKPPVKDPKQPEVDQHCRGSRGGRHTSNFPCYRSKNPSPVQLKGLSLKQEGGDLSIHRENDTDSDSNSSESEHLDPTRVPPQLELRPEVIEDENCSPLKQRGRNHGNSSFPDFLPPPFNSWNLSQLAAFYNVEGRFSPQPRPLGLLERFLDRLLQLEWRQIQTSQEEGGKATTWDVTSSCHKPAAAATSRLSSPKCILQCQRAFPLTFLSSLSSHSALLSGCSCTLCRLRYSTCSRSCCRSAYSYNHHFRLSPTLEHKVTVPLPKRSCSESRAQRFSSPVRTNNHLRRMQASGNIRSPVQGSGTMIQSTGLGVRAGGEQAEKKQEAEFRRRSGSEQRRGRAERQRGGPEIRRGASEYRRGGVGVRRATHLKEPEIKPDAVAAIMDNLPGSKNSFRIRTNREKQVEFVT